jgi:hypothetical protein
MVVVLPLEIVACVSKTRGRLNLARERRLHVEVVVQARGPLARAQAGAVGQRSNLTPRGQVDDGRLPGRSTVPAWRSLSLRCPSPRGRAFPA